MAWMKITALQQITGSVNPGQSFKWVEMFDMLTAHLEGLS